MIEYNVLNKPSRKIDNGGKVQSVDGTFTYDPAKTESYTYYADGNLKTKLDRNGNTTIYFYDIHGRKISEEVGTIKIAYTYDNNGNQLTITDGTGTTARTYDELNRVKTKTVPNLGTSTYTYDVLNSSDVRIPTEYTGEISKDPKGNEVVKAYDKVGRLTLVIADGQTTTYTYLDNGNRQKVEYPDGSKEEYTYYDDNLLKTLTNYKKDGTTIVEGAAYQYTYDGAYNQLSKVDSKGTTSYTYDELNRLETVTEPDNKVTTYNYDAAGNRLQEIVNAAGVITLTGYNYNDQNRLMSTVVTLTNGNKETITYKYDNNGNMTFKTEEVSQKADSSVKPSFGIFQAGVTSSGSVPDTTVYEYDELNQLICAKTGTKTVTNIYNGEGLRVGKDVNGQLIRYMYEYDKVVLEVDKDGKQLAKNVYGTNLISRTVDGQKLFYMYSGHADVTVLLDSVSGDVVASYYYDAFGNIIEQTGNVNNNITFAGYQYDKETNTYYLMSRMYDLVPARFLQEDTYRGDKNDPLSLNLYTYCHNEPLMYWDYDGHAYWGYSNTLFSGVVNTITKAISNVVSSITKAISSGSSSSTVSSLQSQKNNLETQKQQVINDTTVVQKVLEYNGYLNMKDNKGNYIPYGYYGDATKGAVKWFQQTILDSEQYWWFNSKKQVDGVIGGGTWALLDLPEPGSDRYVYMLRDWNPRTTPISEIYKYSEVAPKLVQGRPAPVEGYDTNPKAGQIIQTGIEGTFGVFEANPVNTYNANQIASWARDKGVEYMKSHKLPTSADNEADAYRHFLWNAKMTREIGYDNAQTIATNHEAANIIVFQGVSNTNKTMTVDIPLSTLMDLNNNEVGRNAAISPEYKTKDYTDIFKIALDKGDLITSLNQVPNKYGFNSNLVFDKKVSGEVI